MGKHIFKVDPKGAILLDSVSVALVHGMNGDGVTDMVALELAGRINNGGSARSDILYLMDPDAAAALLSHLFHLLGHGAPEVLDLMRAQLLEMEKKDGEGKA